MRGSVQGRKEEGGGREVYGIENLESWSLIEDAFGEELK